MGTEDAEERYLHLTSLQRVDGNDMVRNAHWPLGRWNLGCDCGMVSQEMSDNENSQQTMSSMVVHDVGVAVVGGRGMTGLGVGRVGHCGWSEGGWEGLYTSYDRIRGERTS